MKTAEKDIVSLINVNDLGRFVTQTNEHDSVRPLLHEKFKVNRIETYRPHMKFPLPPHRKPVHDFIFLTKGSAIRNKGLDRYEVGTHTFFFSPAFQILSNEYMSEDIEGFYGHFDPAIFNKKLFQSDLLDQFSFLKYNSVPVITISESKEEKIVTILERLLYEFDTGANSGFDIICTHILALFLEISLFVQDGNEKRNDASSHITQLYKEALAKYIYEKPKVSDYAELLSISPNHLNRCVQKTTGKSAKQVMLDFFLLEIKVLLKQSSLTISEIAQKMGNKDLSDFSRFFKNKTGMTPSEYRKSDCGRP